jgi:hypothetical protein
VRPRLDAPRVADDVRQPCRAIDELGPGASADEIVDCDLVWRNGRTFEDVHGYVTLDAGRSSRELAS